MPELPEVETTKRGISPYIEGKKILQVIVRNPNLRWPVSEYINEQCAGKTLLHVSRRAKYLLLHLSQGSLLIHLGMSGHLRALPQESPMGKHDHIDLVFNDGLILRYCDPRRFGSFLYLDDSPEKHPLLKHLGPEPLSDLFNEAYLYQKTRKKNQAIKSFIMNNREVVGVGNIYATESLYLSRIHPNLPAQKLTLDDCTRLCQSIKKVLHEAIQAGGTTLRDFYTSEGKPGYFSQSLQIYGRKNLPCYQCNTPIDAIIISGRLSTYCPKCQTTKTTVS